MELNREEILKKLDRRAKECGLSGIETTDADRVIYLMKRGDTLDDAIDYIVGEIIEELADEWY